MKPLCCALLLLLSLGLLPACGAGTEDSAGTAAGTDRVGKQSAAPEADVPADVLAVVNGENITRPMLDLHLRRRSGGQLEQLSADDRETLLLELVEMELIAQNAREHDMHNQDRVQAQIKNIQRAVLAQTRIAQLQQDAVDEEELRALYQQHYADQPQQEYHARHILVRTADQARDVIEALNGGSDFALLARQHSQGPLANEGGDLGWFTADQMVDSFATAAARLERGEYTAEPVRTSYGWHVIHMLDHRTGKPPSFNQIRDYLKDQVVKQRLKDYLTTIRASSDVVLLRPQPADQ